MSNEHKEEISLLELLDSASFEGEVEVDSAVFLTFSIEPKTVLLALMKLFDIKGDHEQAATGTRHIMKERVEQLLRYPDKNGTPMANRAALASRVAFVCNNGSAKGNGNLIDAYINDFIYPYSFKYSFHPKLYVIHVRQKVAEGEDRHIFRMILGSMNFTNSHAEEFLVHFDIEGFEQVREHHLYTKGISVINELLDIQQDGVEKPILNVTNRGEALYEVIEQVGLHRYYFKKEDIPQIITFPTKAPFELDGLKAIFSPFLSLKQIKEAQTKHIPIYTMQHELEKIGYERIGEEDTESEDFYIYETRDENKASTHLKLYVGERTIYAGSLNFTHSAWYGNKELVIRIEVEDTQSMIEELGESYQKQRFKKRHVKEGAKSYQDVLRGMVREVCKDARLIINAERMMISLEAIDWKKYNEKSALFNQEDTDSLGKIVLTIAPKYYPKEAKCLDGEPKKLVWGEKGGLNRVKMVTCFNFVLQRRRGDDNIEHLAEVQYDIRVAEQSQEAAAKIREQRNVLLCGELDMLVSQSKFTDGDLTRPMENLLPSYSPQKVQRYFRKNIPTLEELMKRSIEHKKPITTYLDIVDNKLKILYEMAQIIRDSGIAEERRYYQPLDITLLDKMREQYKMMESECRKKDELYDLSTKDY